MHRRVQPVSPKNYKNFEYFGKNQWSICFNMCLEIEEIERSLEDFFPILFTLCITVSNDWQFIDLSAKFGKTPKMISNLYASPTHGRIYHLPFRQNSEAKM